LAFAYIKAGRPADARGFLTRLLAWVDTGNTDAIKKLLDEMPPDPTTPAPSNRTDSNEP
jgi:hypothetical protein